MTGSLRNGAMNDAQSVIAPDKGNTAMPGATPASSGVDGGSDAVERGLGVEASRDRGEARSSAPIMAIAPAQKRGEAFTKPSEMEVLDCFFRKALTDRQSA